LHTLRVSSAISYRSTSNKLYFASMAPSSVAALCMMLGSAGALRLDEWALPAATATHATTASQRSAPVSVSLSTDVALPDGMTTYTYNSGQSSASRGVDYVKQCGNSNNAPYLVQYKSNGDTMDLSQYITSGGVGGTLGVDVHGRGLQMQFNGEADGSGKGFGCHANWLITFDLAVIRNTYFSGALGQFKYTGRFGMARYAGDQNQKGQGVVFVDGTVQGATQLRKRSDGGEDLEVIIDQSAQFLTIGMLNGDESTNHDDMLWMDPTLTLQDPVGVAAVGDPHLQNLHGERFDLMTEGKHVLINIPRGTHAERAMLHVQANARRLGGQCADLYFQEVNVTGSWAEANKAGGYHYSVSQHDVEAGEWVSFGKVELKIVQGRTDRGVLYLNVYVKHLGRAGFVVGGLLGEDDHEEAIVPPGACAQRMMLEATRGGHPSAASHAVASLE